jgi:hypothetical protein
MKTSSREWQPYYFFLDNSPGSRYNQKAANIPETAGRHFWL